MTHSPSPRRAVRSLAAGALALVATAATAVVVTASPAQAATTAGIDVSRYQGSINWTSVRNAGIQFAFIKTTEGTTVKDANFAANYVGAYNAGVIRGAYHFALPDRSWISDFLNTYRTRTGRYAVIYTTTSWWTSCTGNWSGPWANHPLWLARWASTPGTLPAGAPFYSFWQYTSSGSVPGISGAVDRDYFNGDRSRLIALANNT